MGCIFSKKDTLAFGEVKTVNFCVRNNLNTFFNFQELFSFLFMVLIQLIMIIIIFGDKMKNYKESLNHLVDKVIDTVRQKPILSASLTLIGLSLFILKKQHYKLVVHPDVQGRSNFTNSFEFQHPRNRGMDSQDIQIVTPDKLTLRGWYIKNKNPKYLTIYYHENAGNIGTRLYFIQHLLRNIETNVIIVAYRGFSDSDGISKPTQKNIVDDSRSIFQKAQELAKRDNLLLFVLGKSLGGFSALSTLSQPQLAHSAKGLILQNTFTSIYDVASSLFPRILRPLLWIVTSGSYNSVRNISNIHVPVLFVKGLKDTLIPKAQMDMLQIIHTALKKENFEYVVEDGTHNDTWYVGGLNYFKVLNEFLNHAARL